ncbi:MAG: acyl carrier protein [Flavipsychrobacter sp.]|jgi:acyl carrier protein|nr:acyl carrier protein [Flavipsychrobacter sp.]
MEDKFLSLFREQFIETDTAAINHDTEFRTIDEWSSLLALCVIAMVDEHYSVKLSDVDMKSCMKVADIYSIVSSRA